MNFIQRFYSTIKHAPIKHVKGMHDIVGMDALKHEWLINTARAVAARFEFQPIYTPLIEELSLFHSSLGPTSDAVSKEMYQVLPYSQQSLLPNHSSSSSSSNSSTVPSSTPLSSSSLNSPSSRSNSPSSSSSSSSNSPSSSSASSRPLLALRPEATASVCRVVAQLGQSAADQTLRYFYHGPMFRHENPQRGRLRQFHQVGVECLGAGPDQPLADAQLIACAAHYLSALGLSGRLSLRLNSIGDAECRREYAAHLAGFLQARAAHLSADSQQRLARGSVLRVLDSKLPEDLRVLADAPRLADHLSAASSGDFARLLYYLEAMSSPPSPPPQSSQPLLPPITIDPYLVRGLDYYSNTVFEFVCESPLLGPQQATVLAGGRYHHLVAQLGGADVSGAGWAAGLERLALVAEYPAAEMRRRRVFMLLAEAPYVAGDLGHEGAALRQLGFGIAQSLRARALDVVFLAEGSLKQQMRRAAAQDEENIVLVLGANERKSGSIVVKDLVTREEITTKLDHEMIYQAIVNILSK